MPESKERTGYTKEPGFIGTVGTVGDDEGPKATLSEAPDSEARALLPVLCRRGS